MAVQAQYPSNVLLLNNRNVPEDYDCSLPPGDGLLNQSHMLFNNGGSNPRKRAREIRAAMGIAQAPPNVVNSFSLQSPQLVDLSQLHNHQHNSVSTGLRLSSFADHHHHHHHPQTFQSQQQSQDGSRYSALSSLFSQDFLSQIKQHRDEIDQFLRAQESELHRTLAEKRQRHYRALLTTAEETVARRLREKDLVVENVKRMNAELEARAAQLRAEAQLWQAKAQAQEATAASLQAQLQQAMMNGGTTFEKRDEGGLSCAVGADDAESAYVDPDRVDPTGPKCRGCGMRMASVVVLPCRHLCMCPQCDVHFRACPVCLTLKDSTVEVFLS